ALYAHVIPAFIVVEYFDFIDQLNIYLVAAAVLWLLAQGCRNVLLHQAGDITADRQSGLKTFATEHGNERVFALVNGLLVPAEIISFLSCCTVITTKYFMWLLPAVAAFGILKSY